MLSARTILKSLQHNGLVAENVKIEQFICDLLYDEDIANGITRMSENGCLIFKVTKNGKADEASLSGNYQTEFYSRELSYTKRQNGKGGPASRIRKAIAESIKSDLNGENAITIIGMMKRYYEKILSPNKMATHPNFQNQVNDEWITNDEFDNAKKLVNYVYNIEDFALKLSWVTAVTFFPNMSKFSGATDFIDIIVDAVIQQSIRIDNKQDYINSYRAAFVLHRTADETRKVSFEKGMYISPEAEFSMYTKTNSEVDWEYSAALTDKMKEIIDNNYKRNSTFTNVIFIYGQGGSGKTSYSVMAAAEPEEYLGRNTDYFIIMLRKYTQSHVKNIGRDILENLLNITNNSIIILDGLDELCMMKDNIDSSYSCQIVQNICEALAKERRTIIITTRPSFLDSHEVWKTIKDKNFFYRMATLEIKPFSENLRKEFVHKLRSIDNQLNPDDCEWALNIDKNNPTTEVYSLPFILYLICSASQAGNLGLQPIEKEERDNIWALFRRIFHDVYIDSIYSVQDSSGIPNDRTEQMKNEREKLYMISCHVAFYMWKSGKYHCTTKDVHEIIDNLNYNIEIIELEKFYPLSSFINRTGTDSFSAYEFAHNIIKDFFLCEFILNELNKIVKKHPFQKSKELIVKWIKEKLYPYDFTLGIYSKENKGGHFILEFLKSFRSYWKVKKQTYIELMNLTILQWHEIFHLLCESLCDEYYHKNANLINNSKNIYYALQPEYNSIGSFIQGYVTESQAVTLHNLKVGSNVNYGLNNWYVTEITEDYVILVSSVPYCKQFHEVNSESYYNQFGCTYDNSTLRAWLHHFFFSFCFNIMERRAITGSGNDPVFLLNYEDFANLFEEEKNWIGNLLITEKIINSSYDIWTCDWMVSINTENHYTLEIKNNYLHNKFGWFFPAIKLYK